jgi:hypothetical protein
MQAIPGVAVGVERGHVDVERAVLRGHTLADKLVDGAGFEMGAARALIPVPEGLAVGVLERRTLGDFEQGLASIASPMKVSTSRLDSASSLIACWSCGVITSDCDWRMSRRGPSAMNRD